MNVNQNVYALSVGSNQFSVIVSGSALQFRAANQTTENLNLAVFNFLHSIDVRMVNRLKTTFQRGGFEIAAPVPVILVNDRLKRAGRPIGEYAVKIDYDLVKIDLPAQTVKVLGADNVAKFEIAIDRQVIRSKSESNANQCARTIVSEIARLLVKIGVPAKVMTVETALGLDFALDEVPSGKPE